MHELRRTMPLSKYSSNSKKTSIFTQKASNVPKCSRLLVYTLRSSSNTCPDLCHNSILDEAECSHNLLMTIWNKVKGKRNAGCHSLLCCKPLVVFTIYAFFHKVYLFDKFLKKYLTSSLHLFSISHSHHLNLYIANYEYLFYAMNVAQSGFSCL